MVKKCGESLALPLMFEAPLNDGVFPDDWQKDNIVPVHKRYNRPISFLPIFANIFEKIIFTSLFEYFLENAPFFSLVFFQVILALHNS